MHVMSPCPSFGVGVGCLLLDQLLRAMRCAQTKLFPPRLGPSRRAQPNNGAVARGWVGAPRLRPCLVLAVNACEGHQGLVCSVMNVEFTSRMINVRHACSCLAGLLCGRPWAA